MAHNHSHGRGKKLGITIILNIVITLAQYIGGMLTGSLALMSDAAHNFSDVMALIISFIADKLSKSEYNDKRTYGMKRAEIIAAVINVSTIIIIAVNILIEGIKRLNEPSVISSTTVMYLAGLSILINGLSVLIIKGDAKENMNMKSAYLHLFSDMLTSVAVLIVGIIMYFYNIYWLDSVVSIAIALFLLTSSFKLLLDTIKVLMQFTPSSIDLKSIKREVTKITNVKDIHHIHVWQLTDNETHMTAHIDVSENVSISDTENIYKDIEIVLKDTFNIHHITLQAEYNSNHLNDLVYDERTS